MYGLMANSLPNLHGHQINKYIQMAIKTGKGDKNLIR